MDEIEPAGVNLDDVTELRDRSDNPIFRRALKKGVCADCTADIDLKDVVGFIPGKSGEHCENCVFEALEDGIL